MLRQTQGKNAESRLSIFMTDMPDLPVAMRKGNKKA
jgi:hypothetical protein